MQEVKKKETMPDAKYESVLVAQLINRIMRQGKKTVAESIVYDSFEEIKKKTKKEPLEVFEEALRNVSPVLEVKSKRVGGATYQVPVQVGKERKIALAMQWIIQAAKSQKGKSMSQKLAEEIMAAANNTGKAVKRKDDTHRMAEANKAFAHFAW